MCSLAMETNQQRHAAYRGLHANVSTVAVAFITLITGQLCCGKIKLRNKLMPARDQGNRLEECPTNMSTNMKTSSLHLFLCYLNAQVTVLFHYWCELEHRGRRFVKEWVSISGKLCRHCKAVLAVRAHCLPSPQFPKPVQIAVQCEASLFQFKD